jgi:hypothetical protein
MLSDGSKSWYKHGERHRENDLPAVIWSNGDMYWYQHGKLHRETDAAVICHSGVKSYYLDGKQYPFKKWLKLTPLPEEDKLQLILEN